MASKLLFNDNYQVQPYTLILSHRDHTHQGQLHNVKKVYHHTRMNSSNELSFTLYKQLDDYIERLWDEVQEFKLIYVKELDEYFELTFDNVDSRNDVVKNITCTSLCEAELGQLLIKSLEINTESDIENEDVSEATVFYNPTNTRCSLLHRILKDKCPHYTIGHVDSTLYNIQRSFSCSGKSIYDFLIQDVAEEIGCLFLFDTVTRRINAYDLESTCLNLNCDYYKNRGNRYYLSIATGAKQLTQDTLATAGITYYIRSETNGNVTYTEKEDVQAGITNVVGCYEDITNGHYKYRGNFVDKCPICSSTNIQVGYGEDTTILVDKENLTEEIKYDTDTDSVKNVFVLSSDDDNFNAAIQYVNPSGNNYIMHITPEQKADMPEDLMQKLNAYESACQTAESEHRANVVDYYKALDEESRLEHYMMPAPTEADYSNRAGVLSDGTVQDSWRALLSLGSITRSKGKVGIDVPEYSTFLETVVDPSALPTNNPNPPIPSSAKASYLVAQAVRSFASMFIRQEYFYVDIVDQGIVTNITSTASKRYTCIWSGVISVTKFSDTEDICPKKVTQAEYNRLASNGETSTGKYYYIDNNGNVVGGMRISFDITSDMYTYLNQTVRQQLALNASHCQLNSYYNMIDYSLVNMTESTRSDDGGQTWYVVYHFTQNQDAVNSYKEALKLYSLEWLNTLKVGVEDCRNSLAASGHGNSKDQFYPYYNLQYVTMARCIDAEIIVRTAQIKEQTAKKKKALENIYAIHRQLIFAPQTDKWGSEYTDKVIWLTEQQYNIFCAYRREDEYTNQNFVSDGLENEELLTRATEFYEQAKKELVKSATQQHTITATLANLLVMKEFQPIIRYFELGNFIRVKVEDKIYRLRLVSYKVDFERLEQIDVEFSDLTETADGFNDIQSILSSAKSMTTSYSSVQKQATEGRKAQGTLNELRESGLNSALYNLKSNYKQEITIDERGLLARSYDDVRGTYLDDQMLLTRNVMCFTQDNWEHVSMALGKFDYVDEDGTMVYDQYGLNADFVISGFIQGTRIVAGDIYSEYAEISPGVFGHRTHLDLTHGDFHFGNTTNTRDSGISWDSESKSLIINGAVNANNGTFDGDFQGDLRLVRDASGKLGRVSGDGEIEIVGMIKTNGNGEFGGNLSATGNLTVNGSSTFKNNVTVSDSKNLTVTGDAAFTGIITGGHAKLRGELDAGYKVWSRYLVAQDALNFCPNDSVGADSSTVKGYIQVYNSGKLVIHASSIELDTNAGITTF